jgi:hypothetical protein
LDGLDEADKATNEVETRRPQIDILVDCLATLPRCCLLVLSRPSVDVFKVVPTAVTKSITYDDNEKDIRLYVESIVSKIGRLQQYFESRSENAVEYLVEKAGGIFLWVVFVLKSLESSSSKSRKKFEQDVHDLLTAVGDSELDETFSIALSRVHPDYKSWVKGALSFLTVSIRDIELRELKIALEIALDDDWPDFTKFLEVHCGSFVQLLPNFQGATTVNLIHETFASFLIDPERSRGGDYFIDKATAHREFATLCLKVMSGKDAEKNAVFSYASTFWVDHLRSASKKGKQSNELLISLYEFFTGGGVKL